MCSYVIVSTLYAYWVLFTLSCTGIDIRLTCFFINQIVKRMNLNHDHVLDISFHGIYKVGKK